MQIRTQDIDAIKMAVQRLLRSPHQQHTIAILAQEAGMSASRFTEIFKIVTGNTVRETLAEARMTKAKELLESSNKPIARIATQCGYRNESAFARAFRKNEGITPMEYRRRAKG